MPRGRMINKKIVNDEKVAKLSIKSTLLYTWCLPFLDFEGRLFADMWHLKSIVPFISEITPKNIKYLIKEMVDADLVIYYGNTYHKYLQFKGFKKNQNLNESREAASEIPAPTPEQLKSSSRTSPGEVKLSKYNIPPANAGVSKGEPSTTAKSLIQSVLLKYQAVKGFDRLSNYARLAKRAKQLLSEAKGEDQANKAIAWLGRDYEKKGLEWTLETVINKLPEYFKYKKRMDRDYE